MTKDDINVPKHWDLSVKHNKRIIEMIVKYYEGFDDYLEDANNIIDSIRLR